MTMSSFGKFYHLNPAGPTNFTERTHEYKGSSPKFVPNVKLSSNELITPISPETNRKLQLFGRIEVNQFNEIRLIFEAKFRDDP